MGHSGLCFQLRVWEQVRMGLPGAPVSSLTLLPGATPAEVCKPWVLPPTHRAAKSAPGPSAWKGRQARLSVEPLSDGCAGLAPSPSGVQGCRNRWVGRVVSRLYRDGSEILLHQGKISPHHLLQGNLFPPWKRKTLGYQQRVCFQRH